MSKHDDAIAAFHQGRSADALRLLQELLAAGESSELWNDWAAVQLNRGEANHSEKGFHRALELDPDNTDATINLGVLLLGQGDWARALPLLTSVLPLLPAGHRQIVNDMLAGKVAQPSLVPETRSDEQRLRILVISDTFPDPAGNGRDRRLLQILRGLRDLGNELTFAAREAINRKQCEPLLRQSGIHIYASNSEHAATWDRKAEDPSWSLRDLLVQTQFDIAVLIQAFDRDISIPEQYLDQLRQQVPKIRIAVLADELYLSSQKNTDSDLANFESTEDWAARQWEAFDRADAVLVPTEDDAAVLRKRNPSLQVEVAHALQAESLATATRRILALEPKKYAGDSFSVMSVETLFREHLSGRVGKDRLLRQSECYARLAEQLLREGKPEKAREQLRHIFGRLGQAMHGYFAAQIFIILKRCYGQSGDEEMAERCAAEARRRVIVKTSLGPLVKQRKAGTPRFSVIVPTYNRLPILRKCLAALEAQTLPAKDFEVIVIDDGSLDGTQELLTNYRPPFRFQYLRQANSGTGAARRNGVAHASGEYLLLMNDDTICDYDLLEQHLQTHIKHGAERWAVLGNFEYPDEARRRALTRYFSIEPFMFPQVSMEAACPYGYSHFITCNLSIHRDAVVEAGSFDSIYKLSEDTELGIRLYETGYRVLYHPEAHAFHDHLPYPARNLIKRARVYGADYFHMFGRHPRVMEDWAMPVSLTGMDEQNALRLLHYVEEHRREVEQAFEAVERWDSVDFDPLLAGQPETAALVLNLFRQAVPAIHWFYLFETMLQTMIRELGLRHLALQPSAPGAAYAAGAGS